jgi:hypothetical protein
MHSEHGLVGAISADYHGTHHTSEDESDSYFPDPKNGDDHEIWVTGSEFVSLLFLDVKIGHHHQSIDSPAALKNEQCILQRPLEGSWSTHLLNSPPIQVNSEIHGLVVSIYFELTNPNRPTLEPASEEDYFGSDLVRFRQHEGTVITPLNGARTSQ